MKLIVLFAVVGVCLAREKRSFGSLLPSSLFPTTTALPLSKYPVWKVHKYSGIDLKPVTGPLETAPGEYTAPRDPEDVPEVVRVPDFGGNTAAGQYEEDTSSDSQGALSALDSLGGLASLLPGENGQGGNLLSLLGIGRSSQAEAEDKIGIVPRVVAPHLLKKKKKEVLGLLALSKLLNSGKLKLGSGGISGLLKGLIGGSVASYPVHSAVYRGVPSVKPGFLSNFPFFTRSTPAVQLPDPIIPDLPALKLVPEPPKLPQLSLPGPYKVPYSTGSYVSIRLPKPTQVQEEFTPSQEYGPPATSYGVPAYQPPPEYGTPASVYSAPPIPYPAPAPEHTQPAPASEYNGQSTPYLSPAPEFTQTSELYSPPSQYPPSPPATHYGTPSQYYPPQRTYQSNYDASSSASEPEPAVIYPEESANQGRRAKQESENTEPEKTSDEEIKN